MLSAFHVQLLLASFLLQWYMSQMAVALSFLMLWLYSATARWGWLAGSIGAAVVTTYSSGNGILIWPLLVMMAILSGVKRRRRWLFLIAGVLSIGAFFIGYNVLNPGREKVLLAHPLYALWFIEGVYLGTSGQLSVSYARRSDRPGQLAGGWNRARDVRSQKQE